MFEVVGDVGFGAGGDEDGARRQFYLLRAFHEFAVRIGVHAPADQGADVLVVVEGRGRGAQVVGVVDAFLHGLGHFLVIALVGRRLA
ncbi:MAG: hypothetical protein A2V58_00035 [Candidatus Muproteobacteria bacterium RBG_19FT_COMBO_61_10]|uniref:Uncharacterized protein n=1 Tax=Candidatus Muproteobacteria bacterium RBG_19FT_COMBO_61_10 TaxID=1817761 RepID=A0A1F6UN75_9PROT|nr:MAG: hypothetical protein A2V58_00035 [Candidatus Muproteobacteria bacterium RBG_19FT_COMBO_61_10]